MRREPKVIGRVDAVADFVQLGGVGKGALWLWLKSGVLLEFPPTAARFGCTTPPGSFEVTCGTDAPDALAGAARFGPVEADVCGDCLARGIHAEDQAAIEASLDLMAGTAGIGVLAGD